MMTRHPADETLAAFADGRLNVRAREEMIEHLAACDDCRSLYDLVAGAQEAEVIPRPPAPVVQGNFGKVVAGTLAAAAAVTVVFFTPPVQDKVAKWRTGGVSTLVKASEGLKERPIEGRLAGGFPHGQFVINRNAGNEREDDDYEESSKESYLMALAELVAAENDGQSVRQLHARGVGYLLTGQNRDEAVESLKRASEAAGGDDPRILNDLAAAHIARALYGDAKKVESAAAVAAAERAWKLKKTPEIAWNRALALEYAGDQAKSDAAWNDYLALDSTSPWAEEVRGKYLASDF